MKITDIKEEHNHPVYTADKLAGLRMKMERFVNDDDYALEPVFDMIAREIGDELTSYFNVSIKLEFDQAAYDKDHGVD